MSRVEDSRTHMPMRAAAKTRGTGNDAARHEKAAEARKSGEMNKTGEMKKSTSTRGFASMDSEKQRAIASKGGRSVPDEKRSFSRNRELAAEAGRKGGRSVPDEKRSFSRDPALAAAAGRKGGQSPTGGKH